MAFDALGPQRIGDATILARGMEHRIVEDSARRILVAVEPPQHIADLVRRAQMDGDMILAGEQARHVLHRDAGIARFGGLEALHRRDRSEEHTSELQSLMRISYAV